MKNNNSKDKKETPKAIKISVENNRILKDVSLKQVMESLKKYQAEQTN